MARAQDSVAQNNTGADLDRVTDGWLNIQVWGDRQRSRRWRAVPSPASSPLATLLPGGRLRAGTAATFLVELGVLTEADTGSFTVSP
ncbi:hypothetical protein ACH4ND_30430 [Streptomyces sp. NPDC017179]|uniref:hypothetical protein n=1 Tax=Streptomyces sp. NPDC017179 TaxID=3364979 RepID=UPI0037B7BC94